jgi:hypothetical protein
MPGQSDPTTGNDMTTHTLGPWLIARIDGIDAIVTDDGTAVMDTRGASVADLTLAVNAPLLLAALQAIVAQVDAPGHTVRSITGDRIAAARAAIARAAHAG